MSALHLKDPGCEVARYILTTYWTGIGHHVTWCEDESDGAGFELAVDDVYPLAARVIDGDVISQRLAFMVAVGWLPEGSFQLGTSEPSVRFLALNDFASRESSPGLVPEGVLPLDKIVLALTASEVQTGLSELDRLAEGATDVEWETFEMYCLQVLLDWSRRVPTGCLDIGAYPLGASRGVHAAVAQARQRLLLADEAAELALAAGHRRRRWWSRS